ncbi:jg24553, partial [Pararge aegeria aegeria]
SQPSSLQNLSRLPRSQSASGSDAGEPRVVTSYGFPPDLTRELSETIHSQIATDEGRTEDLLLKTHRCTREVAKRLRKMFISPNRSRRESNPAFILKGHKVHCSDWEVVTLIHVRAVMSLILFSAVCPRMAAYNGS